MTTKLKIFMKKPDKKEDNKSTDEYAEKPKPIIDHYPSREWNVGDFAGKCKFPISFRGVDCNILIHMFCVWITLRGLRIN